MQMIYYAYFHANMKYGIVFCGNSIDIKRVFPLPKNTMRIMTGVNYRSSCRPILKALKILTVAS